MLRDVEDFGRRQPLAVAAVGLALGFAASRFLKASSRSRYAHGARSDWQSPRRPGEDRISAQLGGGAGGVFSDAGVAASGGVTAGAGTGPVVPVGGAPPARGTA